MCVSFVWVVGRWLCLGEGPGAGENGSEVFVGLIWGEGGCVYSGRGKIVSWQNASILAQRYTTTNEFPMWTEMQI